MSIGKRRIRYAALTTGAAVLASLTISGFVPPGVEQDGSRGRPPAPRPVNPSPATGARVIHVEANLLVGEEVDLGAPGRSVGDQFVFSGNLLSTERPAGRVVGRFGGFCVITDLERNAGQCSISAVFRRGQITVQGEQAGIPTPSPVTNAITGGTEEFREAHGEMRLRVLTPATWDLTFHVTGH
ncbi:dirigent protein [Streptomyces sp. XD-27]|uniref:dirigent protein n=1 Tax=Streptomyces sp. XD-27 TaxID=3062779 RepID=UPI0026F43692|nr:dirigent protein [Streptomyces sp. XD-27]WKX69480.1 dirigent protein [Streptomyces sp. XD-27]